MKIFDWLYYFKEKYKNSRVDGQFTPIKTTQENPRDIQSVKEFNKSFESQQQQIQARTTIGHEMDCKDTFSCKGCFKVVPDKIIGKRKIVSSESVREDMKKRIRARPFVLKCDDQTFPKIKED